MTIDLKTHKESILVSALYRPPNTKEKEFIKNYKRLLSRFKPDELSRLIIGLDHNLDFLKHDRHRPTKEFLELNLDQNMLPGFTKPTKITRTSATLIDNIILGKKFQMSFEPTICISDISDHLSLVINIKNLDPFKAPNTKLQTRKLDTNKISPINDKMKEINWNTELKEKNANDSFNIFHTQQRMQNPVAACLKYSGNSWILWVILPLRQLQMVQTLHHQQ